MNSEQLLSIIKERRIILTVQDNTLMFKAPRGAMTPEIAKALKACKQEIMAGLSAKNTPAAKNQDESSGIRKCYCCSSDSWWRKKGNERWICSKCHYPAINPDDIEWRDNKGGNDERASK